MFLFKMFIQIVYLLSVTLMWMDLTQGSHVPEVEILDLVDAVSVRSSSACFFQMNGPPFQIQDENLIGISHVPVRDFFVRLQVFPRSVVAERQTSILDVSTTSLQNGPSRVPEIAFLQNSTRLLVSFYTDTLVGVDFASTEILPLAEWSEITIYLSGSQLTLVCLNSKRPFANRIQIPFPRNVVNSAFVYAGGPSLSAASALLQKIQICSNPDLGLVSTDAPSVAPTWLRTRDPTLAPSPMPTYSPTYFPTYSPSEAPTEAPTEGATEGATVVLTRYVPAPTSSPTPGLPAIPTQPTSPSNPALPNQPVGNQPANQPFASTGIFDSSSAYQNPPAFDANANQGSTQSRTSVQNTQPIAQQPTDDYATQGGQSGSQQQQQEQPLQQPQQQQPQEQQQQQGGYIPNGQW